jgi:hypothetical protein
MRLRALNMTSWRTSDDVYQRLKAKPADAGESLNEFLLQRLSEFAGVPTVPEPAERIPERGRYDGPSSAAVVRDDRDRR